MAIDFGVIGRKPLSTKCVSVTKNKKQLKWRYIKMANLEYIPVKNQKKGGVKNVI